MSGFDDWPDDRRIRETRREAAARILAGLAGNHPEFPDSSTGAENARVAPPSSSGDAKRTALDLRHHDAYFHHHQRDVAEKLGVPWWEVGDDPEADPL